MEKKKIKLSDIVTLKKNFSQKGLHTVCQSAKCPNIGECFKHRTATFLILGNNCTRGCKFCAIEKKKPETLNSKESQTIAQTIKDLGLNYCVITSVTRDDLPDGGANHFAQTVRKIKEINPNIKVEVLVPDFKGDLSCVDIVLNSQPDVFSHNIETVKSLYTKVRIGADYKRSFDVLKYAKQKGFKIKTGIMLGLGETDEEILETIKDVANAKIDILTIGQYLPPTNNHYPLIKEYDTQEFKKFEKFGNDLGIRCVAGKYVRSSYKADEIASEILR